MTARDEFPNHSYDGRDDDPDDELLQADGHDDSHLLAEAGLVRLSLDARFYSIWENHALTALLVSGPALVSERGRRGAFSPP
uniref:Uncharacterized protein n=1 Tax=Thermogemmatispora argillosa TaxID=2045280 RepID=A0A455T3L7_9CHLR|nr:hypothetical protein KTA_01730 [Thermogemmatispora argillosa]